MIALLSLLLVACEQGGDGTLAEEVSGGDTALSDGEDDLAPEIDHEPVASPQSASRYVDVVATITDEHTIVNATVYFRRQVESQWGTTAMSPQGVDLYAASLAPEDMSSGGMHYYIEAVDQYGNVGTDPDAAPSDYFKFDLVE